MSEWDVNKVLAEKNIVIPPMNKPGGSYTPFVKTGSLVFIAGQTPRMGTEVKFTGKVGADLSIEKGQEAARLCALNILAVVKEACGGDLNRVVAIPRVAGLVNCMPDFTQHPQVINGASDFLVEVFGEKGRHARVASGSVSLPGNVAVEVEAVFEIK